MNDIDLAVARIEKRNGVQRRHVHAFGEELDVADDPALAVAVGVGEGAQFLIALERACGCIEMSGHDLHGPPVAHSSCGGPEHLALHERFRIPFRAENAVRKRQRARKLSRLLQRRALGDAVHGKRHAEHPRHVVRGRGVLPARRWAEVLQAAAETRRHARPAHPEHDDPVVGEHAVIDGLGEREQVELRAVHLLVAHVDHVDALRGQPVLGARSVDPRRGGHVQALSGEEAFAVVKLLEVDAPGTVRSAQRARRAVRLVGDRQIELRRAVVGLSLGHPPERVVGAEDNTGWTVAPKGVRYLRRVR